MDYTNNNKEKYEEALKYEIFIKEEYGFAKEKIQDANCIFDIGGHIGYFSQRCRNLNKHTTIHYFEPVGDFYNQAKLSLGNDKNIIFNNCGIGSKHETGTILLNQEKTMQSSKYPSFLNPNGIKIDVNFINLKQYIQNNNINQIDVLKMDIEGMEFEVLPSFSNFERSKINNLIVEVHLLNEELKSKWNQIYQQIQKFFLNTKILNGYRDEIFLLRATKH